MCADGCTHGTCVYIREGQTFATWPADDTEATAAIEEILRERGIERGRE